jgi:hypothetical protein
MLARKMSNFIAVILQDYQSVTNGRECGPVTSGGQSRFCLFEIKANHAIFGVAVMLRRERPRKRKPEPIDIMKNSIPKLLAATLISLVATTVAVEAKTRVITQGRAGYAIIPDAKAMKESRPETRVALVMDRPDKPSFRLQSSGRAGYHYVYQRSHGR